MLAAVRADIGTLRPIDDGLRYDLVFDTGSRLWRVQCKWAGRVGGIVSVCSYSSRRTGAGFTKRVHTKDEVDALAAYCPDNDRCCFLPMSVFGGRTSIQLRLGPTLNNQQAGVNWARDWSFESLHWDVSGP